MAASLAENLCCCARIETEQRMAFQSSASVRLRLSNPHLVTAPHRPVLPPGSSLASCGKSPAARRNQNGPTTPPKTEVSGGNGTWDAAGGHFAPWHVGLLGSRALTRRSSPTKPAKLNDAKKSISDETQSIFGSSYLVALWMGVSRGLRTCQVSSCDQKRMS